jgi:hypothetical protein
MKKYLKSNNQIVTMINVHKGLTFQNYIISHDLARLLKQCWHV